MMKEFTTARVEPNSQIKGYVITSDKFTELLKVCDEIEETPDYYTRKIVNVHLEDENQLKSFSAWVYEMTLKKTKDVIGHPLGSEYITSNN